VTKFITFEPEFEGRVEIFHDNKWGSVCDDRWYSWSNQPMIVCRQLGLVAGTNLGNSLGKAERSVPIWLDNVSCNGLESRLE
jgi:hypothetical protein